MKKFRIVLIDDDQVFLHALSKKLSDAHAVVALASVDEIKSFLEDDARPVDGFFSILKCPTKPMCFGSWEALHHSAAAEPPGRGRWCSGVCRHAPGRGCARLYVPKKRRG